MTENMPKTWRERAAEAAKAESAAPAFTFTPPPPPEPAPVEVPRYEEVPAYGTDDDTEDDTDN